MPEIAIKVKAALVWLTHPQTTIRVFNNDENGTNYSAQKLSIVLNKMQANTRNEIQLLAKNLLVAVAVDRNGKAFLLGATNGLVAKTAKGESGTKMGDRNGYVIEFDGNEPFMAQEVSSSIVSALTTPGS